MSEKEKVLGFYKKDIKEIEDGNGGKSRVIPCSIKEVPVILQAENKKLRDENKRLIKNIDFEVAKRIGDRRYKEFTTKEFWMKEVFDWINKSKEKRQPAQMAFTAGNERNICYVFEHLEYEKDIAMGKFMDRYIDKLYLPVLLAEFLDFVNEGSTDMEYNKSMAREFLAQKK